MKLQLTDNPTEDDRQAILDVLLAHGTEAVGRKPNVGRVGVLLRGDDGQTLGGVIAETWYEWMFVELVYLPAHRRGDGLGTRIMRGVERQAVLAGCRGIWLDTTSFQARPFYETLGFTCVGTLEDYPAGHRQFYMAKTGLESAAAELPPDCVVTDEPNVADRTALDAGLLEMADKIVGAPNRSRFAVRILDDGGGIVGGALARISRNWLTLDMFVMPPGLRRQGLGSKVLAFIEAEARTRGCVAMRLDTFSFQAPGFYARHGYAEHARIEGFPPPHDRHFLHKRFGA